MPDLLVSTAELSASNAAACLAGELRRLSPDVQLSALGAVSLMDSGYSVLADPTSSASVGHCEGLARARSRRQFLQDCLRLILRNPPDLVLCIDSPSFNVPLTKALARRGIPVAWYIPPQEYLWGAKKLARRIARTAQLVLCVDARSADLYRELGLPSILTGHCLASPAGEKAHRQDRADGPLIALFPGSRAQEIRRIAPVVLAGAARIAANHPAARFVLPLADERYRETLLHLARLHALPVEIIRRSEATNLLAQANLVITKAGTTTMEAAFSGCPMVVVYRIHPLTYWIATRILRIHRHLPGISLPNIALGRRAVPELIQTGCTAEAIAGTALNLLSNPGPAKAVLAEASRLMAQPGAATETARCIIDFLQTLPPRLE